jgi:hypothetical protein
MLINRNEPTAAAPRLRVKLLGKSKPGEDGAGWLSRFRGNQPVWGNCEFVFDRPCLDYDWLVVYNDMPSVRGERHTLSSSLAGETPGV